MILDSWSLFYSPVCPVPFMGRSTCQAVPELRFYTFWFWRLELEIVFETTEEEADRWIEKEVGR
jgi:hypothetical protein